MRAQSRLPSAFRPALRLRFHSAERSPLRSPFMLSTRKIEFYNCPLVSPQSQSHRQAFSLIELMVVIAIVVILTLLLVPAFTSVKKAGDVTSAAYTIKGVLDQARTYAMSNQTYTWVGFYEEAATNPTSGSSHPVGIGRVVISTVASVDGARYRDAAIDATNPPPFDNSVSPRPVNNPVILAQLGNLVRLENVHIATTQ